jgi:crotonobetainyl-CoA:carnitine CoA-transferase CaiB-like acyl-CoA transferase
MAERFLEAYSLGHLLSDERFATNESRVRHSRELDAEVARAIAAHTLEENLDIIRENSSPPWLCRPWPTSRRIRIGVCVS